MQNIISGCRTTGVYPFDRSALGPSNHSKSKRMSLAERIGLKFIPLYSPSHRQADKRQTAVMQLFTPEEIAHFQLRYDEGCDIPDERYEQWVQMYRNLAIFRVENISYVIISYSFNFVRSPYRIRNTCENVVVEKDSYV